MCQLSKQRNKSSAERGAGMVGLVLALLTMGLLAASSYFLSGPGKAVRQLQANNTDFVRIQRAIALYVARNDRLPYPAIGSANTGLSDSAATEAQAVLPWKTLGLEESVGRDAWGRKIAYHPTSGLTAANSFVEKGPTGGLTVVTSMSGGTTLTSAAAYVLISYGGNGLGGWTMGNTRMALPASTLTNEAENTDGDTTYVQGTYNSAAATYFDDQLVYTTTSTICTAAKINCNAPATADCAVTSGCIVFNRDAVSDFTNGNNFKLADKSGKGQPVDVTQLTINSVTITGSGSLTASQSQDGPGLGVGGEGKSTATISGEETLTVVFPGVKDSFGIALNEFTASSGTAKAEITVKGSSGNTIQTLNLPSVTACAATQAIFNSISPTSAFTTLVIKAANVNTSFWLAAVNGCAGTTCDASVTGFTYCLYP